MLLDGTCGVGHSARGRGATGARVASHAMDTYHHARWVAARAARNRRGPVAALAVLILVLGSPMSATGAEEAPPQDRAARCAQAVVTMATSKPEMSNVATGTSTTSPADPGQVEAQLLQSQVSEACGGPAAAGPAGASATTSSTTVPAAPAVDPAPIASAPVPVDPGPVDPTTIDPVAADEVPIAPAPEPADLASEPAVPDPTDPAPEPADALPTVSEPTERGVPADLSPVDLGPAEPAGPGVPNETIHITRDLPPSGPPPPVSPVFRSPDFGRFSAPGTSAMPFELQARSSAVQRSGASTTGPLLDALAPLRAAGATHEEVVQAGFGRFPVGGEATYTHDWLFPRFGPGWRLHQGTDIFAPRGTPVRAPADGRVRLSSGGLGGTALYVTEPDGTYYYLAHLAGVAEGLVSGAPVTVGQVIGYNGSSGNAQGTPPHVHFEVHPRGGGPVDPKPVLDRFLADALAAAPDVVAAALAGEDDSGHLGGTPGPADASDSDRTTGEPRPETARLDALAQAGSLTRAPLAGEKSSAHAVLRSVPMTDDVRPLPANLAEVLMGSLTAAAVAGALTGSSAAVSQYRRSSRRR